MACSEFDLIERYFNRMRSTRRDVVLSIGDDCALLSVAEKKMDFCQYGYAGSGHAFSAGYQPF